VKDKLSFEYDTGLRGGLARNSVIDFRVGAPAGGRVSLTTEGLRWSKTCRSRCDDMPRTERSTNGIFKQSRHAAVETVRAGTARDEGGRDKDHTWTRVLPPHFLPTADARVDAFLSASGSHSGSQVRTLRIPKG
jgi:hypothetical protein